jgi:2,3-bisphosphoglycerate-independent phosphoglycerate mutase
VTDECVHDIINAVSAKRGITVILADHGNADEMFTEKNGIRTPKTAHTLNPVPFAIVDPNYNGEYELADLPNAGLANVAATLCNLLGYEAPEGYEPSLIRFK